MVCFTSVVFSTFLVFFVCVAFPVFGGPPSHVSDVSPMVASVDSVVSIALSFVYVSSSVIVFVIVMLVMSPAGSTQSFEIGWLEQDTGFFIRSSL